MRALSRKYANRKSTLRNLATSLILYERILTTTAKAKELRPVIERLLSRAAKNDLNARRRLLQYLFDEKAVKKVLEILVPRFKNIQSGFIKTYKTGPRLGDGAEMTIVEFVEGEKEIKSGSETLTNASHFGKNGQSSTTRKEEDAKKENRAEKSRKPARRNLGAGGTTTKSAKGGKSVKAAK